MLFWLCVCWCLDLELWFIAIFDITWCRRGSPDAADAHAAQSELTATAANGRRWTAPQPAAHAPSAESHAGTQRNGNARPTRSWGHAAAEDGWDDAAAAAAAAATTTADTATTAAAATTAATAAAAAATSATPATSVSAGYDGNATEAEPHCSCGQATGP